MAGTCRGGGQSTSDAIGRSRTGGLPSTSGGAMLPGFGPGSSGATTGAGSAPAAGGLPSLPPPQRTPIPSLTREFRHDATSLRWDVKAFEVLPSDPALVRPARPWLLSRLPDGTAEFLVNTNHAIFRSATMTVLDALLSELAYKIADFTRGQSNAPTFSELLAELRDQYGGAMKLDAVALGNQTEILFRAIARTWYSGLEVSDVNQLFNELPSADREAIEHRMATRSVANPQQIISEGRFLEYAPPRLIIDFILAHPDLFFDGRCWEDSFADLDYLNPAATEEARRQVRAAL